jgi:lysophospholipase L1-like esterase
MSSSTSSSRLTPRKRALLIALMFVFALVLLEVGTREALVPVSRDLDRLGSFPGRARSLAEAPAPNSIVFIGDSVTDRVELEPIQAEWEAVTGKSLAADKFVAYNSNLASWYWMSEQYFWKPDLKPDLIVVTYYDEMGLADSRVRDVGNLARFFTDAGDRRSLFKHDLRTFRQRADYLLSSVSLAYAMRDRIRDRTIGLIPQYRGFARTTNEFNYQYEQEHAAQATADSTPTYDALRRFLTRARQEGVKVCFVAFRPRPEASPLPAYSLDPEVLDMIADAGMLHLDLRDMDELSTAMYEDAVHLNERGRPIYAKRLAQELARAMRLAQSTGPKSSYTTYSRQVSAERPPNGQ